MTETNNHSLDLTGESFGDWQQKLAESPPLLDLRGYLQLLLALKLKISTGP